MVGWKRIALVCWLVVAGSGPLPLWFHQWVCHGPESHGPESHASCHGHSHANEHSAGRGSVCGSASHTSVSHSHEVAHHAVRGKLNSLLCVTSHGVDHDDCVVCYTLAQSSSSAQVISVVLPSAEVSASPSSPDRLLSADVRAAYSSRAPPSI